MRALSIVLLIVASAPSPARACSSAEVGLFELADRAEVIATGRWTGSHVAVARTLVGARRARVARQHPRAACGIEVRAGRRVVVLADAAGQPLALGDAVVDLREHPEVVAVLERWRDGDVEARTALLVEAATGPDAWLARAAARLLVQAPWIDRVGPRDVERLVAALRLRDHRTGPLALVLARTHTRAAFAPLAACLRDPSHQTECSSALGILAFGAAPTLTLEEQTIPGTAGDRLAHAWERWLAALPSSADPIAMGWAARGVPDPGDDRAALSERIRVGPDRLSRILAIDRCERVLGRALLDFTRVPWTSDDALASLAPACAP